MSGSSPPATRPRGETRSWSPSCCARSARRASSPEGMRSIGCGAYRRARSEQRCCGGSRGSRRTPTGRAHGGPTGSQRRHRVGERGRPRSTEDPARGGRAYARRRTRFRRAPRFRAAGCSRRALRGDSRPGTPAGARPRRAGPPRRRTELASGRRPADAGRPGRRGLGGPRAGLGGGRGDRARRSRDRGPVPHAAARGSRSRANGSTCCSRSAEPKRWPGCPTGSGTCAGRWSLHGRRRSARRPRFRSVACFATRVRAQTPWR